MPAARAEQSINNSGTKASRGRERARSLRKGTSDTWDYWTGPDQSAYERHPCAARLCCLAAASLRRSRDPSTRARRMRHRERTFGRQRKHSKHSRGGGKGTAVKVQDVDEWLFWYL